MPLALVNSCADIWNSKNMKWFFVQNISLMFHVSVNLWLCVQLGLLTPTCVITDYYVNKDTPVLLFMCSAIQVYITLQYCNEVTLLLVDDSQMYQGAHIGLSKQERVMHMILCNLSNRRWCCYEYANFISCICAISQTCVEVELIQPGINKCMDMILNHPHECEFSLQM